VRHTVEGKRVVFAQCEERDRTFDDLADPTVGATAALRGKGGEQLGVTLVPLVESSRAFRKRSGVRLVLGVSRSIPDAPNISET
jgi:hypothetical protein